MAIALAQFGPLAGVAAVFGFIALGSMLLFRGFSPITRKICGWDKLVRKYPLPHIDKTGEIYRAGGLFGVRINTTPVGALNHSPSNPPIKAFLSPPISRLTRQIFIPWIGIREASCVDEGSMGSVLTVTVENEWTLQFYLPQAAVPTIQNNIPAERFHNQSFGDLLGSRMGGR